MKKSEKILLTVAIVLAIIICLPLILKGVVISVAMVSMALVLAGMFILGITVALAITSPLWIPFLAGWAAVKYCQRYRKIPPVS